MIKVMSVVLQEPLFEGQRRPPAWFGENRVCQTLSDRSAAQIIHEMKSSGVQIDIKQPEPPPSERSEPRADTPAEMTQMMDCAAKR